MHSHLSSVSHFTRKITGSNLKITVMKLLLLNNENKIYINKIEETIDYLRFCSSQGFGRKLFPREKF